MFLHQYMDATVSVESWRRLMEVSWHFAQPNRGFMLLDGATVAGAYLAFYAKRPWSPLGGVCSLGTWCVAPEHRRHSLELLKALIGQPGYVFTDLTPDQTVIRLNLRLGFRWLDGPAALVPSVPRLTRRRGVLVSTDPSVVEDALEGQDLATFHDLAGDAVTQAVLADGDERCHVVFRRERRRGVPLAILLHVSNPEVYRRLAGRFGSHLLLRHRLAAHLAERSIVADPPECARLVRPPRRMLLTPDGVPTRLDYLYSELARLRW